MQAFVLRILDVLLPAMILSLGLYVLLVLCTGGTPGIVYGLKMVSWKVHVPIIVLFALMVLRFPLRYRTVSRQVFFAHEGVILFSVFLIIYLANGSTLGSSDTIPARYLPLSILREGHFDLDAFPFLHTQGTPYYLRVVNGHYVSAYPVGAALLALPFYLPSALGQVSPQSPLLPHLDKLAAAVIVALSAVVLYCALRRLTSRRMALLITAAYALGSSSLSTSSQALWQHGPSQLALTAALYGLVRGRRDPRWVTVAGLPLAFAVIARPSDLLVALPVGLYVLLHHRRQIGGFLLCGFPPMLFQLWYNTRYFGDPFWTQWPILARWPWTTPFWEGLSGILLSPGRGLFVYSSVFLFSILGMGLAWRRNGDPLLRYVSIGGGLTIMLYSKWAMWWGGHSYGPRLLADLTPILALLLYPLDGVLQRSRAFNGVFIILLVWSVGAHAIGAFGNDYLWNSYMEVDGFPQRLWSWTDNQLVNPPLKLLNRAIIAVRGLPTSRIAPERLSASYRVYSPPTATVVASNPLPLALEVTNEGQAVWLAWPQRGRGIVKLGWRWFVGAQEIPGMSGDARLRYDVYPQQSHRFWVSIDPPQERGSYVLEVCIITKRVAGLSDLRISPIRLTVQVDRRP